MGILPMCFGGSGSSKQPSTRIEDLCHRFSLAQLRKSTNNFGTSHIIGRGGFGTAYRGYISINGEEKEIAVKRSKKAGRFADQRLSALKNEIVLMCQLHHPNLVPLIGFCNDKNEMMVVYDYMPNGCLRDRLDERDSKPPVLSWKKRLEISIGVARGLHYLHAGTKRTIIHRDVNPRNILLDENWVPKLSDFTLSLKGPKFSSKAPKPVEASKVAGTIGYMAPENLYRSLGNITDRSDVYSFGVVLLELICGKPPFQIYQTFMDQASEDEDVNEGEHALSSPDNGNGSSQINSGEVRGEERGRRKVGPTWQGLVLPSLSISSSFRFQIISGPPNPPSNMGKQIRNTVEKGNAGRFIDSRLMGQIAPECWKLYMDITERVV